MRAQGGFSLLEVLVATSILAVALCSVAPLFTIAIRSNLAARTATESMVFAQQKMEELRALTWAFGPAGIPVTDTATDTAVDPPAPNGGTGLSPSPANALVENTAGFVDYVDRFGTKVGQGVKPPPGAVFTRRWAIEPLPSQPDTIVIQVLVTTTPTAVAGRRLPGDARLVTARSRTSP